MDAHPWVLMLPSWRLRIRYKLQGTSNVSTGSNRRPSHRGTHNNGCAAQTYTGTQMILLLHLSFPVWIPQPNCAFLSPQTFTNESPTPNSRLQECFSKNPSSWTSAWSLFSDAKTTRNSSRANKNVMGIRRKRRRRRRWSWRDDDAEELEYRVSSTREGHGQVSCASQHLQGSH